MSAIKLNPNFSVFLLLCILQRVGQPFLNLSLIITYMCATQATLFYNTIGDQDRFSIQKVHGEIFYNQILVTG